MKSVSLPLDHLGELWSAKFPGARLGALLHPASVSADLRHASEILEPLTEIYYEIFRRCPQCGRLYWGGSHFEKLQKRIEQLLASPD